MRSQTSLLSTAWFLALMGTVATALYGLGDSFVSQNIITSKGTAASALTASAAYLSLGSFIGVVVMTIIVMKLPGLARKIDPSFGTFTAESRTMHQHSFAAGLLAAIATWALLFAYQSYDAALVTALAACSVIFVALHDLQKKQITLAAIFVPLVLTVFGAVMTSGAQVSALALQSFLLIFLGRNLVYTFGEHYKQLGVAAASSPLAFTYWRFVWLMVTGVAMSLIVVVAQQQVDLYWYLITRNLGLAVVAIVLIMLVVLPADSWINIARKETDQRSGLPATKINIILSLQAGIGVVLTWLISQFAPGLPGPFPTDPVIIFLRFGGVSLVILGIFVLGKAEQSAEALNV